MGIYKKLFEDDKKITASVGTVVILIMIMLLFWDISGASALTSEELEAAIIRVGSGTGDTVDWSQYDSLEARPGILEDYATEEVEYIHVHNIAETNVHNVTFKLTWTDEPDTGWIGFAPNHENAPDSFTISVEGPSGGLSGSASGSNQHGQSGSVVLNVEVPLEQPPSLSGTGGWNITITVSAGDHEPKAFGAFKFTDSGNDFILEIIHEYYRENV